MKKILYLISFLLLLGCRNEAEAPLGNQNTFIKFIGSEANNVAVTAIEDENNYFILINSAEVREDNPAKWVKLIKTDRSGNVLWTKNYKNDVQDAYYQYFANSITSHNNGYLIIGESIYENKESLLLINVSKTGEIITKNIISMEDYHLNGKAIVIEEENGIYLLIDQKPLNSTITNKILIRQLNLDNLTLVEGVGCEISAGLTNVTRDLFLKSSSFIYAGSVVQNSKTNIRLVNIALNETISPASPQFENMPGGNSHSHIYDAYTDGNLFLAVGETSSSATSADELTTDKILFLYSSISNPKEYVKEIAVDLPTTGEDAATGYAVTRSVDHDFVILGSIGNEPGERSLVLQKVDHLGNSLWGDGKVYGGSGEKGAAILTTDDGGYFVVSTTYYGNIASILLIKTDSNGDL